MRILLAANASYVPPRGGATRSNLVWLQTLAAHGHECRVVAALMTRDAAGRQRQLQDEDIQVEWLHSEPGYEIVRHDALVIHSVAEPTPRNEVLRAQIRQFQPDWVLVSSEDVGQRLLGEASRDAPGRIVYLAHTPQFFPFGPESWSPNPEGAELIRRAAGVVVIGRHMAGYVERHLGRVAQVVHPPIYGQGPWPNLARFDEGLITFMNPCAVKGMPLFTEIARRMPECRFGVLPGWGTTAADREALGAQPNVTVLANRRNIEDILRVTRILLMPSLWYEGFGLIVMEAMLRGIPVVASDSGGLVEAKRGTGFVIPVRPIERYEPVYDERNLPRAVVARQNVEPWLEALRTLSEDRSAYEEESGRGREAASRFAGSVDERALEKWLTALPAGRRLRILLAHNSLYYPAHGGGDKSNRLLIEALAARGHTCRVIARLGSFGEREHAAYVADLGHRKVEILSASGGVVVFRLNGVEAHVLTSQQKLRAYFAEQVAAFSPDIIISSTDDPAQLMLEVALEHAGSRVVYLARATLALPFGPDCAFPSAANTEALRRADGFVGVSQYVADYASQHGGIDAVHVPISLMDPGPQPPALGRPENEFVTMVNPCAVKGIDIFLALADRMPDVRFAAVPTWGTSAADLKALEARANITILPPVDNIDELLARTRVLLVPSVWAEARSRIVVEAMLRGVPVVASDTGGISEAKMGVPYLIPVKPIERYRSEMDEQMVPVAEVPPQDIAPWEQALRRLLGGRPHYEEISQASRKAALRYVEEELTVEPFERYLYQVLDRPCRSEVPEPPQAQAGAPHGVLERLSPERRRLLALRLQKAALAKTPANPWFPALDLRPGASIRLFAFPHAGAGAAAYLGWNEHLAKLFSACPVRLPGRESRSQEPAFRQMGPLIESLGRAIQPGTDRPFVFFGHSMGAGIAFELARWLRRHRLPLPLALLVSGAWAPQLRVARSGDLDDAQILEEMRRREGIPPDVLADPDLMRIILPPLKADTMLYRTYTFSPEEPLACPIRAYGGTSDPAVDEKHLAGWAQLTTGTFAMRMFPGGHFYLRSQRKALLDAVNLDLEEILNMREDA